MSNEELKNKELLTVDELLQRIPVSKTTLHRNLKGEVKTTGSGDLRMIKKKKIGGKLFFVNKSVDEFIYD